MALPDVPQPKDLDETFKQLNYFMDGMFKHNAFAPPVGLAHRKLLHRLMRNSITMVAGGGCGAQPKYGTTSVILATQLP